MSGGQPGQASRTGGYQGQQSNINPWSGYTPPQAYPGQNMQNFLNLYQYRPFPRAHFTNDPQSSPIPQGGTTPPATSVPPPTTPPVTPPPQSGATGNPLPPPGMVSGYGGARPIASPSNTPQSVFNDILSKYGQNAAMTFAMHNRGTMGNIGMDQLQGLAPVDRNRMVNTYSVGTNDAGGDYKMDLSALGNPFDPNSPIARYRRQLQGG